MAFFRSWQTWVKLTFVLGCAICLVLTYAVGVRYSNKRKLKKHTIRIAMEIAERGEMAEASRRSDEVPFGIRAIERGCIVEGVWNSKATTPLQTPTSSKASSPVLKATRNTLKKHKRDSSLSNVSHVDIPESALVPANSRAIVFCPPNALVDKNVPPERNQIAGDKLDMDHETSLRGRMDDGSGLELYNERLITEADCGLSLSRSRPYLGSSWTSTGEELGEQLHPDDSASQISSTKRDISDQVSGLPDRRRPSKDTQVQNPSSQAQIISLSKDKETLEYMNAHRRCHAAETGQLIPRVRRKASSGDFNRGPNTSICEPGKDNSGARSVSWPMLNTNSSNNSTAQSTPSSKSPSTPSLTPNLRKFQTRVLAKHLPLPPLRHIGSDNMKDSIELPDPVSPILSEGSSLMETRSQPQPNPPSLYINSRVTTSKPCPSSWTDRFQQQLEEIQMNHDRPARLPLTNGVLSYHNKTARKINPGFELLPSGTLATANPVKEWGEPTISWTNTPNGVRVSRKLQKRDRSGSRSRRPSSEHECPVKETIR